jgi:uncharacterized membrane protein
MQAASTTSHNIKKIADLEKNALASRSVSARIGDSIATQAGKMWFIFLHAVWFGAWIWFNARGKSGFDPAPFPLLNSILSLEAIFLSLFILMSQNRSASQADQRNHLELQINLLAEEENTKMLEMLQALCAYHKLNISNDPEVKAMTKKTEIHEVLSELNDNLPTGE